MKNSILFLILLLFNFSITNGQTIVVNDGVTHITLSDDYENAHVEENTPIVISNVNTVKISGDFHAYGSYDEAEMNSYDIVIIAQPNTSIGVVKKISPEALDPANGTTVIRTSTGGPGIQDPPEPGLVIFPNPVSDVLNVEITEGNCIRYEIYSFEGEIMLSATPENKKRFSVNVESLEQGIYILKLELENGRSKSIEFIKN